MNAANRGRSPAGVRRSMCAAMRERTKSRDLIQGPRLAISRIRNSPRWLSCGGAGYCPRVRKVYTLAATCVFGDLILTFGLARRRGVPDASPPCVSRSGRKTLPARKAH